MGQQMEYGKVLARRRPAARDALPRLRPLVTQEDGDDLAGHAIRKIEGLEPRSFEIPGPIDFGEEQVDRENSAQAFPSRPRNLSIRAMASFRLSMEVE